MRFWFHAVWSRPSRRTVALGAEVALGFWAATSPHVCSPTCLPAASTVLLRARNATASVAGRPNGLGEGSTESVSPVPLASFIVLDGHWFDPGSRPPDSAMRLCLNMLPFDIRCPSRDHITILACGECIERV